MIQNEEQLERTYYWAHRFNNAIKELQKIENTSFLITIQINAMQSQLSSLLNQIKEYESR